MKDQIELARKIFEDQGPPTYMLCSGKDMNAMGGVTYFPEDHIFEWDETRDDWRDLTLGINFKDMGKPKS